MILRSLAFVALLCAGRANADEPLWFWYSSCGAKSIVLTVAFDHELIRADKIPVCRAERGSAAGAGQQKRISFPFYPGRKIQWLGYPSTVAAGESPASAKLRIDIWEAGADPDAMILGISIVGAERIYMNTVLGVQLDRANKTEIAPGLVVEVGATDLPLAGKLRPGGVASTARVKSDPDLLDEFKAAALGFRRDDFVFISDVTRIDDFGAAAASRIRARIREHFGVEVESGPVLIADILEQIQRKRSH
jgi:hypothetical protein